MGHRFVALAGTLLVAALSVSEAAAGPAHFADANNPTAVEHGSQIYRTQCGSCHGRYLEGTFLWQLQDQYAHRRAPAHDASGHTWMHSDEDLFHITKYGRFPGAPNSIHSYMPAFEKRLRDDDIVAVLAYIKAQWPLGIRVSQSMLNPHMQGLPKDANTVAWTLPPTCMSSYRRWKAISR
jgi:mono/diheme cytochrome c family protein